jgi:hypothetical protein
MVHSMLTHTARALGAAVLLGCSDPDNADQSPFLLWGVGPGMQLDAVEQTFLREDNVPWGKCEDLGSGARRCERQTTWVHGRLEAVAGPGGRVVYISFAPAPTEFGTGRDLMFDEDLSAMERKWVRTKGVRTDPHGVSEANPRGIVEFSTARGRWKALVTFGGRMCTGRPRPCPALVQLVDWRAAEGYVQGYTP